MGDVVIALINITHGQVLGGQPEEILRQSINSLYYASSDRCGLFPSMPFFSALATCCVTLITLSGLREIESMPASTRKAANSG